MATTELIPSHYDTNLNLLCCNDCVLYAVCNARDPRLIFDCILTTPYVKSLIIRIHSAFFSDVDRATYEFVSKVIPFGFSIGIKRYTTQIVILFIINPIDSHLSRPKVYEYYRKDLVAL